MKVILVCPRFVPNYWSYESSLRLAGKKWLLPPLGLITVAALLPPHWRPRLKDLNIESITDREILRLRRGHADRDARPAGIAPRDSSSLPQARAYPRWSGALTSRASPTGRSRRRPPGPRGGRGDPRRVLRGLRRRPRPEDDIQARATLPSKRLPAAAIRPPSARAPTTTCPCSSRGAAPSPASSATSLGSSAAIPARRSRSRSRGSWKRSLRPASAAWSSSSRTTSSARRSRCATSFPMSSNGSGSTLAFRVLHRGLLEPRGGAGADGSHDRRGIPNGLRRASRASRRSRSRRRRRTRTSPATC